MKTDKEKALEIAQLMEDGKGKDVVVLDVSQLNSWTDFFVIAFLSFYHKYLKKMICKFISQTKRHLTEMTGI